VDFWASPVRRGDEPTALQTLQGGMPSDQKEGFSLGCKPPTGVPFPDPLQDFESRNQWPRGHPGFDAAGFRAQMEAYRGAMVALGREICSLIAASLGLAEDYFAEALAQPNATVRLLHYPVLSAEATRERRGCCAHTDWGFITLLLQDDCGELEIETASGGWRRRRRRGR
jgi:isopenicillin N synthase-like dioxygenase